MYEETAAIMRALLSPEALSSSKHILRILESLEVLFIYYKQF